jgi:hypothetical protein
VLSQTAFPALMFIPGMSVIRTPTRVAAYLAAPLAWVFVAWCGRGDRPGGRSFPARPWLMFCTVWLTLSILHPDAYSLTTAIAQAALYVAILSPAFWAPAALESRLQLPRLLTILFLCSAASAVVGVGQVFLPSVFNPPIIPAMGNIFKGEDLMYEISPGRKIIRPCGLTDTPGAVSPAGATAALIGLCWALRPITLWKRLASLGLGFVGVAVIYFTHVRSALVMLACCLVALTGLFVLQKSYRQAALLATAGGAIVFGALAWTVAMGGSAVIQRFASLVNTNPAQLYYGSRGVFVEEALSDVLWRYPLGYGMGWWGMIYASFGNMGVPSKVWVEVMVPAWVYDGGFPLLIGYVGALTAAMYDSTRIALTCKDREISYWAAVIVASNLSVLATCLSYVTFVSPMGVQFWLLAATLHAAGVQAQMQTQPAVARGAPRSGTA